MLRSKHIRMLTKRACDRAKRCKACANTNGRTYGTDGEVSIPPHEQLIFLTRTRAYADFDDLSQEPSA